MFSRVKIVHKGSCWSSHGKVRFRLLGSIERNRQMAALSAARNRPTMMYDTVEAMMLAENRYGRH